MAKGGKPELVGKEINKIKPVKNLKPFINEDLNQIVSSVIYIDNFGNVVTNLKKDVFEKIRKGRSFEISVRNYKFKNIYNNTIFCTFYIEFSGIWLSFLVEFSFEIRISFGEKFAIN